MNRWSNRFVSLLLSALVAACQHAPPAPSPAAEEMAGATVGPVAKGGGPLNGGGAAKPGGAGDSAAAAAAPVPERATQQYAEALKSMRAGRAADAELEFKQLSVAYPTLAGPEANLGLLYLQSGRLPEAQTAFTAAIARNPGNTAAGNGLGIVDRKLGKFAEAEAAYQRTMAADPQYAPTYLNLGVLYDLYLAEPKKALEQFEHYLDLVGENKQVSGWVIELRKRAGAPASPAKKEPA